MLYGKKIIGTVGYLGGLMALPEAFAWCWGQMIAYNSDYGCEASERIHYVRSTVSFHAFARNNLIDQMAGDWLVMMDTDIIFDPDIITRLIHRAETYKLDVLSALYTQKSEPYVPVMYKWDKSGEKLEHIGKWEQHDGIYFIPIASAGAGCLFVRRPIFDRIRGELKEGPFDITHPFGEDHSFFLRLKKLGIQAYLDPSIEVHHLKLTPLSLDNYIPEDWMIGKKEEIILNGNR